MTRPNDKNGLHREEDETVSGESNDNLAPVQAAQEVEPTVPERASDSGRQMAEVAARAPAVPLVVVAVLAGVAAWLVMRRRR
ncbi:hypothetical protein ACGFIX_25030 [Nocardia salmonicida]|uniref:hypothetical protein n=1 Tax=Nocardia salmonicida TaxID=53431 RepID=UPI003710E155